jgi:hypothetical protein
MRRVNQVAVAGLMVLSMVAVVQAQQPAGREGAPAGARRGGAAGARQGGPREAPKPIPLFFKETWKEIPGNVPVTQEHVLSPQLELKLYGKEVGMTAEGGVPHLWTGLCAPSCAVALRNKDSYADLTGKAKMKWLVKTSGFHQVRPVVKLADGTWLVGDFADSYTYDFHESEFFFADLRWLKLDMPTLTTKGTLLNMVDLSKVDEIGIVDLTPGSGHGLGGFSDVGWIEVYGKPVARS